MSLAGWAVLSTLVILIVPLMAVLEEAEAALLSLLLHIPLEEAASVPDLLALAVALAAVLEAAMLGSVVGVDVRIRI